MTREEIATANARMHRELETRTQRKVLQGKKEALREALAAVGFNTPLGAEKIKCLMDSVTWQLYSLDAYVRGKG